MVGSSRHPSQSLRRGRVTTGRSRSQGTSCRHGARMASSSPSEAKKIAGNGCRRSCYKIAPTEQPGMVRSPYASIDAYHLEVRNEPRQSSKKAGRKAITSMNALCTDRCRYRCCRCMRRAGKAKVDVLGRRSSPLLFISDLQRIGQHSRGQ